METATSGNAEYREVDPKRTDIHFSLDLHTVDALDPERITEDLEVRKNHVRSQIFRNIANKVIPNMVWGHGSGEVPDRWSIESESSGTSSMASPKISEGVLSTDHHMEMDISFTADREIEPSDMVYLARDQVAIHIADSVVFDMEHRFLGKTESNTSSESTMKDGVVDEYHVTDNAEASPQEEHGTNRPERAATNEDVFGGQSGRPYAVMDGVPQTREQYGPGNGIYAEIDELYSSINDALTDIRELRLVPPEQIPDDFDNLLAISRMLRRVNREKLDIKASDGYTIDVRKYNAKRKTERALDLIREIVWRNYQNLTKDNPYVINKAA